MVVHQLSAPHNTGGRKDSRCEESRREGTQAHSNVHQTSAEEQLCFGNFESTSSKLSNVYYSGFYPKLVRSGSHVSQSIPNTRLHKSYMR